MICILIYGDAEFLTATTLESVDILGAHIAEWIIATDIHDARRRAEIAGEREIAETLYRRELEPAPGKYLIAPGVLMLVQP